MIEISKIIEKLESTLSHPKATRYIQPPEVRKARPENLDPYRNVFEVDINRIVDSKAYRRLKHKTQIIWAPKDAHIRTRLTHTEEVVGIARTISRLLGLNEDLTIAIARAHDIGHPPFGHAGERALIKYLNKTHKGITFDHHEQALKILQKKARIEIAPNEFAKGLNLTWQVEDGILNCSYLSKPKTLEARVVGVADDIAFVLYDYEELKTQRAIHDNGFIKIISSLGATRKERLDKAIKSTLENSNDDEIKMGKDLEKAINEVIKYEHKIFVSEDIWTRHELGAETVVCQLIHYLYKEKLEIIKKAMQRLISRDEPITFIEEIESGGVDRLEAIITYVAYMTDTFALDLHRFLFSPETLDYFF